MIGNADAIRFLSANFDVTTEMPKGEAKRHTLFLGVDPSLYDIELPEYLFLPKLVGTVKNCFRIVSQREMEISEQRGKMFLEDSSLFRVLRGEETENPVLVKIELLPVSPNVFELRISDNGRGIITNELFGALIEAETRIPDQISPALRDAIRQWRQGNPFALNQIPLGDLDESIYQLGVSAGMGSEGSGIGLWGSMMMLLKLGGKTKLGRNFPHGFYESILLPRNLSVSPEEVERVAKTYWLNYSGSYLRVVK